LLCTPDSANYHLVIPGLSSIKKYFVILSVIEEVGKIKQRRIQLLLGHRTMNSFCRALELSWNWNQ
jgi:hypothetical protein